MTPADWPAIAEVEKYNRAVREQLDERLNDLGSSAVAAIFEGPLLNVAIEHRLMHAETLAYLFHSLPVQHKASVRRHGAPIPIRLPARAR